MVLNLESNSTTGFAQSVAYIKFINKFVNDEYEYYGVKMSKYIRIIEMIIHINTIKAT